MRQLKDNVFRECRSKEEDFNCQKKLGVGKNLHKKNNIKKN